MCRKLDVVRYVQIFKHCMYVFPKNSTLTQTPLFTLGSPAFPLFVLSYFNPYIDEIPLSIHIFSLLSRYHFMLALNKLKQVQYNVFQCLGEKREEMTSMPTG